MTDIITAIIAVVAGGFLPLFIHKSQWFLEHMETDDEKRVRESRAQAWRTAREKARTKAKETGVEFIFDTPKPEERPVWARVPEDLVYMFLIVGVIGIFTAFSQSPFLFTTAGRADLADRGLLTFVIACGIGFKGFMIPFGTVKFFQGLGRMITIAKETWQEMNERAAKRRQDHDDDEGPETVPALTNTIGSATGIVAKADDP